MGINIGNILREAEEDYNTVGNSDDQSLYGVEGDIDHVLGAMDLEGLYDKVCPITGTIASKMCEAAADPLNIPVIYDEEADQYYMDYNNLKNYCEASGLIAPGLAAMEIMDTYNESEYTHMNWDNLNIVFPSKDQCQSMLESCGQVGYVDVKWSSNFLADCINAGLKTTTFINPGIPKTQGEDIEHEAAEAIQGFYDVVNEASVTGEKIALKIRKLFGSVVSAVKKEKYDSAPYIKKRIKKIENAIEAVKKQKEIYDSYGDDAKKAGRITAALGSIAMGLLTGFGVATSYQSAKASGLSKSLGNTKDTKKFAGLSVAAGAVSGLNAVTTTNLAISAIKGGKLFDESIAQLEEAKAYLEAQLKKVSE